MRNWKLICVSILFLAVASPVFSKEKKPDIIQSAEDAVIVATVVVRNIYGDDALKSQLPLVANLKNRSWVVTGTLHADKGGVVEVWISKSDARVVKYTHGE